MGYFGVDDQNLDVDRHGDLRMGVNLVANRDRCMNDLLDDRNLDAKMDGNLCHRMNGTDDRNDLTMVVSLDVSRGHRMSDRLDDLNLDANRVNRNCDLHDRMTDENSDVKNLHVMYY